MSGKRFCVKCGREVPGEDLVRGYCIDCYLKYHGVFKSKPRVEVVVCPKCGSWYFKGAWHPPADTREVLRRILLDTLRRFLNEEVELVDVQPEYDSEADLSGGTVRARLSLKVGRHSIEVEEPVEVKLAYRVCDRCLRRSTGRHEALVQVRFDPAGKPSSLYRRVYSLLQDLGLTSSLVEVEELKDGFDAKFEDIVSARRYAGTLERKFGAKLTESFKSVRYDSRRGRWSGVLTISARIPVIEEGDIIEYNGKLGVVEQVADGYLRILLLESGVEVKAPLSGYWSSLIKKPRGVSVSREAYTVTAVDKSTVYLLSEETGEVREHRLDPGSYLLKPGDRVIIVSSGDREVLLKLNRGGESE
ncbi:MAG: 60S ribosomal export protein NMD3 [Desulfurococcus sp.]|nr:60S ribosomal export protein NMD3 [Desulfurococcus sp.]